VIPGENDLETCYPEIAAQWAEENSPLTPRQIRPFCSQKVWWVCGKGHKWQAVVNARVRTGSGCPYCTNRKVLAGFNDLATAEPKLADRKSVV